MDRKLRNRLMAAGFDANQAEALFESFALVPHKHTADQITDFDDAVREASDEDDEDEG